MSQLYSHILTDNGLTEEQWDSQIAEEYITANWFKNLMGPTSMAPIQVKMDLSKSRGDAITIGIRSQLIGGRVDGTEKGQGNEGRVEMYNQRLTIDQVRYLVKIEAIDMTNQRVSWSMLNEAREALVEKNRIGFEEDLIEALSDTSVGRVRGRYLYGALDSNWNATHSTALANIDATDDKLSTTMIEDAKMKAKLPVNAHARIRPMRVVSGMNSEDWFVFVGHTYCIRDLIRHDAAYRNAQLLLPPNANRESPLFTGNAFKGNWDGVLIYEYDRMPLISSTIQVGHCFLMGAQAAAVVWGQMVKFGHDEEDVGHDQIFETHEIRGIEKIVYNRNEVNSSISNEDNGMINVFAAAVAN